MSEKGGAHGSRTLRLGEVAVRRLGYGASTCPAPECSEQPVASDASKFRADQTIGAGELDAADGIPRLDEVSAMTSDRLSADARAIHP